MLRLRRHFFHGAALLKSYDCHQFRRFQHPRSSPATTPITSSPSAKPQEQETGAGDAAPYAKRNWVEKPLSERIAEAKNRVPTEVRVKNKGQLLQLTYSVTNNASSSSSSSSPEVQIHSLLAELLRVKAPSTDVTGTSTLVIYGKRGVRITDVFPAGNYALRISFSDGHEAGIFPYDYLLELSKNKWRIMREYVVKLREKRKSRNPPVYKRRDLQAK